MSFALIPAPDFSINDRYAAHHALSEVGASFGSTCCYPTRDELLKAATSALVGDPVLLSLEALRHPAAVVAEIRARYSGRTRAPESVRRYMLAIAVEIERAALGKVA